MAKDAVDPADIATIDQRVRVLEQASRVQVGDLDMVELAYSSDPTADVEVSLNHSLQRVPKGYFVTSIDAPGVVYKTETPWSATKLFLKCSAANAKIKLLLF